MVNCDLQHWQQKRKSQKQRNLDGPNQGLCHGLNLPLFLLSLPLSQKYTTRQCGRSLHCIQSFSLRRCLKPNFHGIYQSHSTIGRKATHIRPGVAPGLYIFNMPQCAKSTHNPLSLAQNGDQTCYKASYWPAQTEGPQQAACKGYNLPQGLQCHYSARRQPCCPAGKLHWPVHLSNQGLRD